MSGAAGSRQSHLPLSNASKHFAGLAFQTASNLRGHVPITRGAHGFDPLDTIENLLRYR